MNENIIDTFINIENAAHTGAFGDNPRPIPTDAQTIAGNYKLGRTTIYGLPVAIEQPRHSYRTGLDKNGKRWTNRLAAHYGFFSGTKSTDGDGVDCFIGFYPQSEHIYIINQYVDGRFDEFKVMLCFPDEQTARDAYLNSYDKGWTGLQSMVKASISQFKWWLKNGNMKNPLAPTHLPYEGLETMNQHVIWDNAANPTGMTLDKLLYEIKRADSGDNLIFDAVCMRDILEGAESVMTFDALVTPYAKLERKMQVLKNVMDRSGGTIKTTALQISDPFKQGGVAQVAVIFELSDGQTVSIFFHNPDIDPRKLHQDDELISWKWLLNRKDVTIVVAPEHGVDLNIKDVAIRIIKLADKNSPAFIRANTKRAEKMQAIEDIKTEIVSLEQELKDVQHELEVAKIEAEDRGVNSEPMIDHPNTAIDPEPTKTEPSLKVGDVIGPGITVTEDDLMRINAVSFMPTHTFIVEPQQERASLESEAIEDQQPITPEPIPTEQEPNEQANQQTEVTAETETGGAEVGVENPEPVAELPQGLAANEGDVNSEYDIGAREDFLDGNTEFDIFRALHQFQTKDDTEEGVEADFNNDALYEFSATAFIVDQKVKLFGGSVVWGNFDATAYNGSVFDSVVTPGSIVGQIADKDGNVVARVRIEENGVLTVFEGDIGVDQVGAPTAILSKITGYIAKVFGGWDNALKEHDLPNLGLNAGAGTNVYPELVRDVRINAYNETYRSAARKIMSAIAEIDWNAIVDIETANAAATELGIKARNIPEIIEATNTLEEYGINPAELSSDRVPGWEILRDAQMSVNEAQDKIFATGKKRLKTSGVEKLAKLPVDASLEEKAAAVFEAHGIQSNGDFIIDAIKNKDVEKLRSLLSNLDNKSSRTVFEMATGVKLAKTVKGTLPQIDEWAGITPEQRATIEAEKQTAREADNLLSDLKYAWNPLEYVNVMTSVGSATMQDWLVALYGSGYTHIETRKKGAATTYWMVNKEHKAQGFTKSKVFNAFLKAALAFGEGDTLLSMKKALKALGIDVAEQELTPSESVDAAYSFNATDDFKEWLAESIDKTEQSPFLTAKAMDEAAKRNGADIEWGFFGGVVLDSAVGDDPHIDLIDEDELGATFEPDNDDDAVFDSAVLDSVDQDGYVGKISKDGVIVGRIDMGDDGKALVFVGESGDVRVKTKSGIDFTYSDDDAAEMVDLLLNIPQENQQAGEVENEPETENEPVPVPGNSDEVITPSVEEPGEMDNPTEEQINETKTVEELAPSVTSNPELDKQRAKLKSLSDQQERMKAANKVVNNKKLSDEQKVEQLMAQGFADWQATEILKPDYAGRTGYASYQLTNNNAVIKSTQKRIEQLEAKELAESLAASGERETSYDFDGGTIDLDYGDDRLRVNFDSKPAPDMISKLKQNGFKWSPTNTAWQRQLTDNAISTANYLFGTTIKTAAAAMNAEVNKPRGDVIVPATETQPQGNPMKAAFEAELEALKSETDIETFDRRLDEIAERIEQAGLLEELDKELNGTADQLTALLAEAEKNAA